MTLADDFLKRNYKNQITDYIRHGAGILLNKWVGSQSGRPGSMMPLAALSSYTPFSKPGKRTLAKWDLAANTVSSNSGVITDQTPGALTQLAGPTYVQVALNTGSTSVRPSAVLATALDATGTDVHLMYKLAARGGAQATATSFEVRVYSSGTPTSPPANYHKSAGTVITNGNFWSSGDKWIEVSTAIEEFVVVGSGATLTALTWASFEINPNGAGCLFCPGQITLVPKAYASTELTPIIFTLDGIDKAHMTVVAQRYSLAYNFPFVAYCDVGLDRIGLSTSYMNDRELRVLQDHHGWQIAQHSSSAETQGVAGTQLNPLSFLMERGLEQTLFQSLGLFGYKDACFGSVINNYVSSFEDQIWEGRKLSRTHRLFISGNGVIANPGDLPFFGYAETLPFGDPHAIRAMAMNSYDGQTPTASQVFDKYVALATQARTNRGIVILSGHTELSSATSSQGGMDLFMAWLDARRDQYRVTTFTDLPKFYKI